MPMGWPSGDTTIPIEPLCIGIPSGVPKGETAIDGDGWKPPAPIGDCTDGYVGDGCP